MRSFLVLHGWECIHLEDCYYSLILGSCSAKRPICIEFYSGDINHPLRTMLLHNSKIL